MADRYGRWIAALIVLSLLLVVVILFGTSDLNLDQHTLTDVRSAPILSTDTPAVDGMSPLPLQKAGSPVEQATPSPAD